MWSAVHSIAAALRVVPAFTSMAVQSSPPARRRSPAPLRGRGRRIDHLLHFSDLCRWKATDLSVLADYRLVLGEIDAEGLAVSDIALDPLDVGAELAKHLIRLGGSAPQLLPLKAPNSWDFSFNHELPQCHGFLP